ncbi:TlpA family protein disulfide reductase [Streptomyces echinatus]|uniref:TlpA family protein disulfide reductase n=1 Tax=Streptomyces echinatus TaxID=67293 RepID=UPI0037BB1A1C
MNTAVSIVALVLASASCALSLAVATRVKKILDPLTDNSVVSPSSFIEQGTPIPDVGVLRDTAGEEIELHHDQDEVWLLTFLSSTCGGCAAQLSAYKELVQERKIPMSRAVSVVTGEGAAADAFAESVSAFSQVLRPQENLNALLTGLGVRGFPTFLMVTPTGEVKYSTSKVSMLEAAGKKLAGV